MSVLLSCCVSGITSSTTTKIIAPAAKAKAYGMEKNFSKELGKLIYFYNENRSTMVRQEKVNVLLNKVDDLKGIMGRNIDMVLEREGKLVDLVEQSDSMLKDTKVRSDIF